MTVCVAAICARSAIIGAADRMLTGGDTEFEPPQAKILTLTNSIVAMVAGDSALQTEIAMSVRAEVVKRVETNSDEWLPVADVANTWSLHFRQARSKRIERALLAPLGLDTNSYISRQREMDPDFVNKLATEMINFETAKIQTIVTGVDMQGPHIYIVSDAEVSCHDGIGFAAIGAGYWHADSQFMFARHASWKPLPETLLLTYAAKKRAEVAPGVGRATDMFSIGAPPGTFFAIPIEVIRQLEAIYRKTRTESAELVARSNKEVTAYVQKIVEASVVEGKEQAASPKSAGDQSPNQENPGAEAPPPEAKPN